MAAADLAADGTLLLVVGSVVAAAILGVLGATAVGRHRSRLARERRRIRVAPEEVPPDVAAVLEKRTLRRGRPLPHDDAADPIASVEPMTEPD